MDNKPSTWVLHMNQFLVKLSAKLISGRKFWVKTMHSKIVEIFDSFQYWEIPQMYWKNRISYG